MAGTAVKDRVERRVSAVLDAVQSGPKWRIGLAYLMLLPLDTGDVIAELFLWIDDLKSGVDESALLQAAKVPASVDSRRILQAVTTRDVAELQAATGSTRLQAALPPLLILVVALKEGRARLDAGKA